MRAEILASLVAALVLAGCVQEIPSQQTSVSLAAAPGQDVEVRALAVAQAGRSMMGVSYPIQVHVTAGSGHVYIATEPATMTDTDQSATEAARQAAQYVGVDVDDYDFLIRFDSDVDQVGGASAGGQMALGIVIALWNHVYPDRPLYADPLVAGTGTIGSDGSIGVIGGAIEKAEAAAAAGMAKLVLPAGQTGETTQRGFRGSSRTVEVDMDPICQDLDRECIFVEDLPALVQAATLRTAA